jgi:ATP-dependent Clp protease ATP-binding subunit ClpC
MTGHRDLGWTDRAKWVVKYAQQSCAERDGDSISPEDLLVGILSSGRGCGLAALEAMGLNLRRCRAELRDLAMAEGGTARSERVRDGPLTQLILAETENAARRLGCNYVGTEHVILGLLAVPCGASRFLIERGVKLDEFEREVTGLLGHA